jgi:hypothetical protein
MRRLALVFAIVAMISTMVRIVTPERIARAAAQASSAPERFRRAVYRACISLTKRFRPLLPMAN